MGQPSSHTASSSVLQLTIVDFAMRAREPRQTHHILTAFDTAWLCTLICVLCCTVLHCCCRLAAERGAEGAAGPGSLRVGLLDQLYQLAQAVSSTASEEAKQQVKAGLRITQL